ncbi:hypothetical protein ACOMHN_017152 [Nucella lapillus]
MEVNTTRSATAREWASWDTPCSRLAHVGQAREVLCLPSPLFGSARELPRRSSSMWNVYKNGLSAELKGSTKMAMATLTCPEMGTPFLAIIPSRPMGNQQRKSVITTASRRRAMAMSWAFFLELLTVFLWERMDQKIKNWPTAIRRNMIKLKTIITLEA